jgi:predicted dehydrogenase
MPNVSTQHTALRIGILGCANIARQFVRDVSGSPLVQIVAIASRDAAKAEEFGSSFQIAHRHASYEALLSNPEVEAVYIPLPNSMHAQWAIAAARYGKHVLCEKPLALGAAEAAAMFAAAKENSVFLLEAYPYWFQPQTAAMLALIEDGSIGGIRSMQASFGFTLGNPQTNIRMNPDLGGGALLDAGSYPISLIRLVMGEAPVSVQADSSWAESGVDISTSATLFFSGGRRVQMSCSMEVANHRRAIINGTHGTIETEYLNHTSDQVAHPHGYLASQLRVRRGIANSIPFEDIISPTGSGFRFTAEAFARMVSFRDFSTMEHYASASRDIAAVLEGIAGSARSRSQFVFGNKHSGS